MPTFTVRQGKRYRVALIEGGVGDETIAPKLNEGSLCRGGRQRYAFVSSRLNNGWRCRSLATWTASADNNLTTSSKSAGEDLGLTSVYNQQPSRDGSMCSRLGRRHLRYVPTYNSRPRPN